MYEENIDIEFMNKVIQYNHERYISFKQGLPFEENKEFEKVLNSRYQKVSRIKKRLFFLLTHYSYIWFCTCTFINILIY